MLIKLLEVENNADVLNKNITKTTTPETPATKTTSASNTWK